ncbi:hypothetical protein KEJ15_09680 [Candidatus Bathyarchaeota archaeon]|nr:hypothetical protein [Candidatus Bathyarchaeota archaeon]
MKNLKVKKRHKFALIAVVCQIVKASKSLWHIEQVAGIVMVESYHEGLGWWRFE